MALGVWKVRITNHDSGWKGTWYSTGETYFVFSVEMPRPYVSGCHRDLRHRGGIRRTNFEVVPITFRDLPRLVREWREHLHHAAWERRAQKVLAGLKVGA